MNIEWALNRTNVTRAVVLMSVMAFPLVAYAQFGNGGDTAKTAVSQTATPQIVAGNYEETVAATSDSCTSENWPNLSKNCIHGATGAIKLRHIALTAAAAAASAVPASPVKLATNVSVARYDATAAPKRKVVKHRAIAARRIEVREAFADAGPSLVPDSWLPTSR